MLLTFTILFLNYTKSICLKYVFYETLCNEMLVKISIKHLKLTTSDVVNIMEILSKYD